MEKKNAGKVRKGEILRTDDMFWTLKVEFWSEKQISSEFQPDQFLEGHDLTPSGCKACGLLTSVFSRCLQLQKLID